MEKEQSDSGKSVTWVLEGRFSSPRWTVNKQMRSSGLHRNQRIGPEFHNLCIPSLHVHTLLTIAMWFLMMLGCKEDLRPDFALALLLLLSQNRVRKPTLAQQCGCLCNRAPRPTVLSISLCFQLHQVTQVKKSITWRFRLLRWQSEVFVEAHLAFSVRAVTDEHKKHLFQAPHLETLLWSRPMLNNVQLLSKIIQWNDIWDSHWGTGAPTHISVPSWTILH